MPLNFTQIREQTATVTVEYAGETAAVTYYPRRVTKSMVREVAAIEGDGIDKLIAQLVKLIIDLDVVDDEGKPLPVTAETLESIPIDFLVAVMKAINEAAIPGEAQSAAS